jgi:O-antigen/teichoic acid export membrane protein
MQNVDVPELVLPTERELPNAVERGVLKALDRVPGLRGLSASRRVMTAMRGGSWTMAGYGASQFLKLASTLTLARMLVPQAFGAVALVNVFLSGLEMLSDLGIGMDVVQHPRGDEPSFINTAFMIQAARGIALWVIATALAYPFARFYHQPEVMMLLVVGSLTVLLRGLTSGSIWGLTRHVQLGKYNMLLAGADLFGFLVSLVWATVSPTAWALVVGRVASVLALVVASHVIAEHPVSIQWDSKAAKDIFAFGTGIFLSTATYFLAGESERLVVAKFVTLAELGCLSIALSVSWAGTKGLQQIISQVFFPMMSASLRENRENAARHFRRSRHLLLAVSCCASVGFILLSHRFVSLVLGPKYADAGWMLQLMGVRGALELYMSVTVSMLFALGTSKYAAIGNGLKLAFMAIGLTVAFGRYGLHAALWILTLAPVANYIPLLVGLKRHCQSVVREEMVSFLGFAATTAAAGVLFVMVARLRGF